MKHAARLALCAIALVAACGGRSLPGKAGGAGTSGGSSAAGTSGSAGTSGAAGASAIDTPTAGTGAAGTAAAGTTGVAGTSGLPPDCAPFGEETLPSGMCASGGGWSDGACRCRSGLPNVCAETCVDVLTDPSNCGCCGHTCEGTAACIQGKCGPAPVVVVPGGTLCQDIDLAISGGTLYWTDKGAGRVSSMPTSGGVVTTLASDVPSPTRIAVSGDAVYWLTPNGLMRAARGGPPEVVVKPAFAINGFVVSPDGAHVYYSTDATVMRVAATGGVPTTVVREERPYAQPWALALDGDRLVYPAPSMGLINVIALEEGEVVTCGATSPLMNDARCLNVAQGQFELLRDKIVTQRGDVLWASAKSIKKTAMKPDGVINHVELGTTRVEYISSFAVTATNVYFAERSAPFGSAPRAIYKAPLDAKAPADAADPPPSLRIARDQPGPRSLVVDDQRVYWSTGTCAIMATPQ